MGRWGATTTCNWCLGRHRFFIEVVLKGRALTSVICVARCDQRGNAIPCGCNNSFLIILIRWSYLVIDLCFILINAFQVFAHGSHCTFRLVDAFLSWHATVLGDAPELVQVGNHLASLARRDCNGGQRRGGIHEYCLLLMTMIVNSRVSTRLFGELLSSIVSEIESGL